MIKTYEQFAHFEEKILGIDLDGVLNNFTESYNIVYKKYFPEYPVIPYEKINDWNYFTKYNYDGYDPYKWFNEHKAEAWLISTPYKGAIETMKNVYKYTQNNGIILRIVTSQPSEESKKEAVKWLTKHEIKYDDISFVWRSKDKWNNADVMVDDSPKVLESKPDDKISIKVMFDYNEDVYADFEISSFNILDADLIETSFEKLKRL
jgi:5'(3')-deoxyribonucleotidase